MWTLPSPAPLPDLISLVTVLVMRKVISIARNIHIMGHKVVPPAPAQPLDTQDTRTGTVGVYANSTSIATKTNTAIINIPQSVLLRADRVIE